MQKVLDSIAAQAKILGIDFYQTCNLNLLEDHKSLISGTILNRYKTAISLAYLVPASIMADSNKELYDYYVRNSVVPLLDRAALYIASLLEKNEYKALPIPALNPLQPANPFYFNDLVASKAGLGWIGKNNHLISKQYGTRLICATILTDLPETEELPEAVENLCHDCSICADKCPEQAISGLAFHPRHELGERVDREQCINYSEDGTYSYRCLKCLNTCPYNK